jgi:hypothetical protein
VGVQARRRGFEGASSEERLCLSKRQAKSGGVCQGVKRRVASFVRRALSGRRAGGLGGKARSEGPDRASSEERGRLSGHSAGSGGGCVALVFFWFLCLKACYVPFSLKFVEKILGNGV